MGERGSRAFGAHINADRVKRFRARAKKTNSKSTGQKPMEFSWQIDFGTVLSMLVMAIGVIGGWYDLRNRALNNAQAAERAHRAADAAEAKALAAFQHSATVLAQLNDHREKVASEYVTLTAFNAIRGDIQNNFARLGERLDRMIERRIVE